MGSHASVVIIQEHLPAFRVPFYEQLRAQLAERGVCLKLVFAPNQQNTFLKGQLEWAIGVPIRRLGPLAWQPVLGLARSAALVIVQQEAKYAVNPVLQCFAKWGGPPMAFWGHGKNFQAGGSAGLATRLKGHLSTKAHWWFAYNDLSARVVANLGFPPERITSVGNAIDTTRLIECRKATTEADLAVIRSALGLRSGNVAVYTGGLYPLKRIEFMIQAATLVREKIPDFELIVIGDGPDRHLVRAAAAEYPWIHDVGPKSDTDKVPYWVLSKLLIMPGGVGLVILDSFALGVPMVTTDTRLHGPEIDYLRNGENGVLVPCGDAVGPYAGAIIDLLRDEGKRQRIAGRAQASAADHTIERMAGNFAKGVFQALEAARS